MYFQRLLLLFVAFNSGKRYNWDRTLPRIRAQLELSSTFVYDYKMSTSGSYAKNSHLTQGEGGERQLCPCLWTELRHSAKWNYRKNTAHEWIYNSEIFVTPSFYEWVVSRAIIVLWLLVGFSWLLCQLLCNTCLICRSVRRHGHYCHSSPLAEVRIPRRAAASVHFVVINKGVGQSYLCFDTRQLTIPILFSWIGSNVQQEKPLRMHCNTSKCV